MSRQEKKLFATVPLGFEKKAVIAYLEQLNQAYEAELSKREETIRRLEARLAEAGVK